MQENSDLFSHLDSRDQKALLKLLEKIQQNVNEYELAAWEKLDSIVIPALNNIDFLRIADTLQPSSTYYRIPIQTGLDNICIILFIFKFSAEHCAILLHTYPSSAPNKLIYTDKIVENREPQPEGMVLETFPHTHTDLCHSCVAWTQGKAEITEEIYTETSAHKLKLLRQNKRALHSCVLDDSYGEVIHSISVSFKD